MFTYVFVVKFNIKSEWHMYNACSMAMAKYIITPLNQGCTGVKSRQDYELCKDLTIRDTFSQLVKDFHAITNDWDRLYYEKVPGQRDVKHYLETCRIPARKIVHATIEGVRIVCRLSKLPLYEDQGLPTKLLTYDENTKRQRQKKQKSKKVKQRKNRLSDEDMPGLVRDDEDDDDDEEDDDGSLKLPRKRGEYDAEGSVEPDEYLNAFDYLTEKEQQHYLQKRCVSLCIDVSAYVFPLQLIWKTKFIYVFI